MNKKRKENKGLSFIKKIWKDSVWSKIISAGLILLIATIWTKYSQYSIENIYDFLISGLTYKAPVFIFLSAFGAYFIINFFLKLLRKKPDPIWDEQVGNYKFKELYKILSNQNYPVGTVGMEHSGIKPPNQDLLKLFHAYSPMLNRGIDLDSHLGDGGYLYGVLAPKLVGYGLVNKLESKNLEINVMDIKYETSEVGHKFFSLIEKNIHLNEIPS